MPGQLPTTKKSKKCFLYNSILGPLKSCFDQLDQEFFFTAPIFQILVLHLKVNAVS